MFRNIWAATWQNQQNEYAPSEDWSAWASAQSDPSLRCLHEESLGPYLSFERIAKTLIRLGGCPGWSESSLGAHSFCLFLSCRGSYWHLAMLNSSKSNSKSKGHNYFIRNYKEEVREERQLHQAWTWTVFASRETSSYLRYNFRWIWCWPSSSYREIIGWQITST